MIMANIHVPVKWPKWGSENVHTRWSLTAVLAWISRLLSGPTVKIFDKQCGDCGHEFQVFRK